MKNKEKIHDSEIGPLMEKLIAVCNEHKIPFFATFKYSDDGFCTSSNPFGSGGVFTHYEAMRQCAEGDAVNIDKYLMWLSREAKEKGHTSMMLTLMGVPMKVESDF